jgi:hypothetical protein
VLLCQSSRKGLPPAAAEGKEGQDTALEPSQGIASPARCLVSVV